MGVFAIVVVLIVCVGVLIYLHIQNKKRDDEAFFDELFNITNKLDLTKEERYWKMVRHCMNTKGRASTGAYMGIEAFNSMENK